MNSHTVVFVGGRPVKINKLQSAIVTEKVLQQLNAEPKVIISENSALRAFKSKSDRNVPDLSHIANNEECCTAVEDISVYHDKHNQNASGKSKNGNDSAINDIEAELDKMFCLDNELSTIHKEPSKAHSKPHSKNRRVQKQDLKELLIKLFGSPLEDIVVKKYQPKKIQTGRRHTLPVSINIPREILKPLKVSQKRKSATSALCKIQKKESVPTVCELPRTKFELAELLVKEETIRWRARIVVKSDFETAIVMDRPTTGVAETVKRGLVIDLTGEDDSDDNGELVIDTSGEEVKEEPSMSSENASVPAQAPSMPLLSPVSPAQAAQSEATLPETSNTCISSQRPPPHIPVMVAPKPPLPRARAPTKRPYQDCASENQQVQTARSQLASVRLPAKRPAVSEPVESGNQQLVPSVLKPSNQNVVPQAAADARNQQLVPTISGEFSPLRTSNQDAGSPPAQDSVVVPPRAAGQGSSARPPAVAEPNQQVAVPAAPLSSVRPELRHHQAPFAQGQASPLSTHSYFANLRMLQADKTSQQAPDRRHSIEKSATSSNIPQVSASRVAMHQSASSQRANLSQPRPQEVQLQATVSSMLQTAQHQAPIPQMFAQLPQYPGLQGRPAAMGASRAPPLIRMLRPTRTQYEFHLISNAACGERILPHVLTMARWKASAIRFCEEVQTYLTPNDFKQDYGEFSVYTCQSLTNFGKKLIRDLSSVEVENFDFGEVCTVISRKLQEQNCSATIYRVCVNIHAMIKSCEEFCLSPFTKKFFHTVKTCIEKIEQKSQQATAASFTLSQLKQLELQIQQYLRIQKWLDFAYGSSNRPQARPHRTATKKHQRKATDTNSNTLKQSLQHTMLKTMLQHQNLPDWSGRSNDNPTRPDLTAVIPDKPMVPTEQTSVINSAEKSQPQPHPVPVQVLLPQPPVVPAEIPAIAPSPSRKTSVIAFTPTERTPPVENQAEVPPTASSETEQNQEGDVIDLTWIDDGDEAVMLEEITESKAFFCKIELYLESETGGREVVSPADSGLGSPRSQTDESFKCLCGKQAIYVCACNSSMYCGRECQLNDWADHQKWCQGQENSS